MDVSIDSKMTVPIKYKGIDLIVYGDFVRTTYSMKTLFSIAHIYYKDKKENFADIIEIINALGINQEDLIQEVLNKTGNSDNKEK